jgi:hypothetical protein
VFELSDFYDYCRRNRVDVIPYAGVPQPGATVRDRGEYAVFLDFTKIRSARLLRGVCCHELGHVATGALHKVSSPYDLVERSEYRANRFVAERYLTAQDFREAFAAGYTELWQLAEYFDLPEQDVKNALTYWSERKNINFNSTETE